MTSLLWGVPKDLHLVLPAVCGEHEVTLVAKMQKSTHGLASILLLDVLIEQPFMKYGIRIWYMGGGVPSDEGGFSIDCVIEDTSRVPSARVLVGWVCGPP